MSAPTLAGSTREERRKRLRAEYRQRKALARLDAQPGSSPPVVIPAKRGASESVGEAALQHATDGTRPRTVCGTPLPVPPPKRSLLPAFAVSAVSVDGDMVHGDRKDGESMGALSPEVVVEPVLAAVVKAQRAPSPIRPLPGTPPQPPLPAPPQPPLPALPTPLLLGTSATDRTDPLGVFA